MSKEADTRLVSDEYGEFRPGDMVLVSFSPNRSECFLGVVVKSGRDSADAYVFMTNASHPIRVRGMWHVNDARLQQSPESYFRGVFERSPTFPILEMGDVLRRLSVLENAMKKQQKTEVRIAAT